MLFEPDLCVVEGEDGALILAPVRRPCCLELLCCQGCFRAFEVRRRCPGIVQRPV